MGKQKLGLVWLGSGIRSGFNSYIANHYVILFTYLLEKKKILDVLPRSWEFIKPHSQFATCKLAWNVLYLGKSTQKAKKWTAGSGQRKGKSPGKKVQCFWSLFAATCYKNKQTNLTRHFWVTCQTPVLLAANLYLGFQLPRPSPFCQITFSLRLCHLLPPAPDLFPSQARLFLHFISLKRVWFKAHWNASIDFNRLWIGPSVFVSCRHPQLPLTQPFLFSCKVSFYPFLSRNEICHKNPSPAHSILVTMIRVTTRKRS